MFTQTLWEKREFSPRDAERVLTLNTFPGQRPLKPRRVNELANAIREDLFIGGRIDVAVYANGGTPQKYLVNGQHQSNAVILAKKPIEVDYREHDCPTMDDVSLLYRQFDNGDIRTLKDVVRMELHCQEFNWTDRVASLLVSGANLYEGGRSYKNEKVDFLKKYAQEGNFLNNLLTNVPEGAWTKASKHLQRSPVVHAVIATWKKCQRDSEIFWISVRDGEGLRRNMPAYRLREYLKSVAYYKGGNYPARMVPAGSHEITSKCITAWNAFRSGKTTSLKYYPGKAIPKPI